MSTRGALYSNKTASAAIKSGNGLIYGFVVNSHTSGTVKLWDSTAASGTVILNTYTFPSGSQVVSFAEPIAFVTGLYATIGGTADITFIFN
jgi:hypothetical protein